MTAPLEIRAVSADDHAAWLPLWQGYLRFYKAEVPRATTEVTFARLTGGTEPMGGFIARDESGAALGIVVGRRLRLRDAAERDARRAGENQVSKARVSRAHELMTEGRGA